eukprot:jgi/Astpho2/8852/Aster-x1545
MKFAKLLAEAGQGDPRHAENLQLRYKQLKKHLKILSSLQDAAETDVEEVAGRSLRDQARGEEGTSPPTADDMVFVSMLNEDLSRFNDFFIEQEEVLVIRLKSLEDQIPSCHTPAARARLTSAFVALHGEMVLLLHWSMLNFQAVIKILKKHDKLAKQTKAFGPLWGPFLTSLVHQPFASTDGITQMVKAAEQHAEELSVLSEDGEQSQEQQGLPDGQAHAGVLQDAMFRRTQDAMNLWQVMGQKAATPSTVLPPGIPAEQQEALRQSMCLKAAEAATELRALSMRQAGQQQGQGQQASASATADVPTAGGRNAAPAAGGVEQQSQQISSNRDPASANH